MFANHMLVSGSRKKKCILVVPGSPKLTGALGLVMGFVAKGLAAGAVVANPGELPNCCIPNWLFCGAPKLIVWRGLTRELVVVEKGFAVAPKFGSDPKLTVFRLLKGLGLVAKGFEEGII